MASDTTPPTPPTLVRIVCSPYDSDSEDDFAGATSPNSFSFPSSDRKKARARGGSKRITFLDEISRNAVGFGQSMAVHANHTLLRLVAHDHDDDDDDDEDSDGYDSDDSRRRWRKSKLDLLMIKALDRADRYTTAFCNVVDHVPRGCIGSNIFMCGEDDSYESWSSFDEDMSRKERRSRTKKIKRAKKKSSSAVPYDDRNLSDSLSVTSSDVSYTFEEVNKSPTKVSSTPKKVAAIAPCPKASLLRQRREEFMRRNRKDSGDDAIAVSRGAKRPEIKKAQYVPSQELRAKYFGSSKHENFDREASKLTKQQNDDELYGESIPDILDSSSNDDSAEKKKKKYKWQSKVAHIDLPCGNTIFLTSSHLGPSVSRFPFDKGGALQVGDIILRVNGEDVSSTEGSVVENVLKSMSGKRVHVSFLRKRISA